MMLAGVGDLSTWEFSGNDCYYVCYDHFIGDPNCIHCFLFRLSDPTDVQLQQIHFWLNFVRARIAPAEPIGLCQSVVIIIYRLLYTYIHRSKYLSKFHRRWTLMKSGRAKTLSYTSPPQLFLVPSHLSHPLPIPFPFTRPFLFSFTFAAKRPL